MESYCHFWYHTGLDQGAAVLTCSSDDTGESTVSKLEKQPELWEYQGYISNTTFSTTRFDYNMYESGGWEPEYYYREVHDVAGNQIAPPEYLSEFIDIITNIGWVSR